MNSSSLNPLRILVVDDNPAIHADFRKILSHADETASKAEAAAAALFDDPPNAAIPARHFELDHATQGKDALCKVTAAVDAGRPYAMAFMDVRMPPGWDGIETCARIWEIYPDLQIVLCTAYADYSWEEMIAKLGQSDRLVISRSLLTTSRCCNWPMH